MKNVHASTEMDLRIIKNLKSEREGKKTVAFVGMAPRTRVLAPFDDLDVEVWTLGRSWRDTAIKNGEPTKERWVKRISRHFEIHPDSFLYVDNKPDELHTDWLKQEHPFPIYMDDAYHKYPASVRYPIERAVTTFGRHFTSTMSYMFPIAHFDGFDRIEVYGFEMGFGGEYAYQMPEVAYHIGWFRALHGYNSVVIPPESKILRAPLYAYEEMYNPILTSIEQRVNMMQQAVIVEEKTGAGYEGATEALKNLNEDIPGLEHNDKFKELLAKAEEGLLKQTILVNHIKGALHDDKVLKDAIYYMMPPSYKATPNTDLAESTISWDGVDLPWKEVEDVTETREES